MFDPNNVFTGLMDNLTADQLRAFIYNCWLRGYVPNRVTLKQWLRTQANLAMLNDLHNSPKG